MAVPGARGRVADIGSEVAAEGGRPRVIDDAMQAVLELQGAGMKGVICVQWPDSKSNTDCARGGVCEGRARLGEGSWVI